MKNKAFWTILIIAVALCIALTAAHIIYDINAYKHCSIIYFIGKELW